MWVLQKIATLGLVHFPPPIYPDITLLQEVSFRIFFEGLRQLPDLGRISDDVIPGTFPKEGKAMAKWWLAFSVAQFLGVPRGYS